MSARSVLLPRPVGEAAKLGAFLRRDFLMAWSYRTAFISDAVALFGQALVSAFVARIVDPAAMPSFGGEATTYLAFVTVGIAFAAFVQVGLTRLTGVIGGERFMGTLESVLITPTKLTTLQLGWVAYDLLYVPVRTLVFFVIMAATFGVHLQAAGTLPAVAAVVLFLPFVWGVGVASASATLVFRRGGIVNGAAVFILTFSSGAYFPLDVLPAWLAASARYNPAAVAIDVARRALLGGAGWAELLPSLALLAGASVVSFICGLRIFAWAFRRELRSGGIGLY